MLYICTSQCGSSSVGRAPAFQAGCREFEPRLPLFIKTSNYFRGFFFFGRSLRVALFTLSFALQKDAVSIANASYLTHERLLSASNSIGVSFCLNNRADNSPFNIISEPITSNQLPSRNPNTGISLKA